MADNDLYIWIDESGTLSKNPKNPQTYVYAGYWCLEKDINAIESTFSRHLIHMFPSCQNGEKKASQMKERKKRLLIQYVVSEQNKKFHPVFIPEDLTKLDNGLSTKQGIQLHKNYLLRRFVEESIRDYRQAIGIFNKAKNVVVNIDDQSRTELKGFDPFPLYLSKYFRQAYYSGSWLQSEAKFDVRFQDSNSNRSIQLCDVLANCKYNHYTHGRTELHQIFDEWTAIIKKLP